MKKINCLEEYISIVKEYFEREGCAGLTKIFYRGQSNCAYKLMPSLSHRVEKCSSDKENYIAFEREIIERSKLEFPDIFKETNTIDELALMQHYGLPTRLMDVTENPLVALYFACIGNVKKSGEVFVFNSGLNAQIYTSYNESEMRKNNKIAFVRAKTFSSRQKIQQGLFMWFPDKNLKGISKQSKVISDIISIPAECKKILLNDLKIVGISAKSLFPDNIDVCCKELLQDITKDAYSC